MTERKTSDLVFVRDLLDCIFNLKVDEQDTEKMYRLGRWSNDKICPLLISFKNMDMKEDIVTNLRNLKHTIDKFKDIGIISGPAPKGETRDKRNDRGRKERA